MRRSVFLSHLAVLAAILALLSAAPVRAQEVVALAFEGWQRTDSPSGVVTFTCASPRCPAGARVSYKRQPHRPELGLAPFEAHHRRLAREAPSNSQGRVRDAVVTDFAERAVEGVRVLSGRRAVAWSDGSRSAAVDALLIGPASSFSVVSDAGDPAAAAADFSHFLPRLVDLVLVTR